MVCAVESWSDCRSVIWPASCGIRWSRLSTNWNCSPSRITSGRMSSTTLPFVVSRTLRLVLEHLDELLLRRRREHDEELLHPRPLEHLARAAVGCVARDAGDRAREALEVLRQLILQLTRDVDVRVERLDHRRGDLVADRVVGDQLLGRGAEVVLVERLALHEVREQADDEEDDPEHHEEPRADRTSARRTARRDGSGGRPAARADGESVMASPQPRGDRGSLGCRAGARGGSILCLARAIVRGATGRSGTARVPSGPSGSRLRSRGAASSSPRTPRR